jgi:hypothetical protein
VRRTLWRGRLAAATGQHGWQPGQRSSYASDHNYSPYGVLTVLNPTLP